MRAIKDGFGSKFEIVWKLNKVILSGLTTKNLKKVITMAKDINSNYVQTFKQVMKKCCYFPGPTH